MTQRLVVDASVVVDLLGRFRPEPIEALLFAADAALAAPALLDVEVLQALRRLDLQGAIPASRGDLTDCLRALRICRYPHGSLLEEIWALRRNPAGSRVGSRDLGPDALKPLAEPQRARAALLPKGLSLHLRH